MRTEICDFADVKGQESTKRAIEVALSGGHSLFMIGPHNSGKTMLASCIPSVVPSGAFLSGYIDVTKAEFDSAVKKARGGVLIMDEFMRFKKPILDALRKAYDDSFSLIITGNQCPCGYQMHPTTSCECTVSEVRKWLGPVKDVLDLADIVIEVAPADRRAIESSRKGMPSKDIKESIDKTRKIQISRQRKLNALLTVDEIEKVGGLDGGSRELVKAFMSHLAASAGQVNKVRKVARTIADMDRSEHVLPQHLSEAMQYRSTIFP